MLVYSMTRPLRVEFPNALYHITSRGNVRKSIYKDKKDRQLFLDMLDYCAERFNWIIHAYCLMNNHYHILIETPDANLSKGMRHLNGVYTQTFNRRHKRAGHVFQGRYKAILIQKESHLLEVARYVVLNPVRARAVKRPDRWRWSSYMGTAGLRKPHPCLTADWILSRFGKQNRRAMRRYRQFVHDGIGVKPSWGGWKGLFVMGDGRFRKKAASFFPGVSAGKEFSRKRRFLDRPKLGVLVPSGLTKSERNVAAARAVIRWGYNQKDVADHIGLHYSTLSVIVKEAVNQRSKT